MGLATASQAVIIKTSDPVCTGTPIYTGDTITFTVTNGGGDFTFCNDTDATWTNLLVAINTTISPDDIDCVTTDFKACNLYTTNQPDAVYAFFYGTCVNSPNKTCHPQVLGVPIGGELEIDLNCTNNDCTPPPDWPTGTGGTVYTNVPTDPDGDPTNFPSVPEPASITLLMSGLGAAYLGRKRWTRW